MIKAFFLESIQPSYFTQYGDPLACQDAELGLRSGANGNQELVVREAVRLAGGAGGLYSIRKGDGLRRDWEEKKDPCQTKNDMSKDTGVIMKWVETVQILTFALHR